MSNGKINWANLFGYMVQASDMELFQTYMTALTESFIGANRTSGILYGGRISVLSGMQLKVSSGVAIMPDGKLVSFPETIVVIPTAHATNPRIDRIELSYALKNNTNVLDVNSSSVVLDIIYEASIKVSQGVASVTPSAPLATSTKLSLGFISVAASQTAIVPGNISQNEDLSFVTSAIHLGDKKAFIRMNQFTGSLQYSNDGINYTTFSDVANGLKSATTNVLVNNATAPLPGQVLTALSPTSAAWISPSADINPVLPIELAPVLAGAPLAWTRKTSSVLSGKQFTDIIFGNGVFVTYYSNGNTNPLYYSTDGITWSSVSLPTSTAVNKIVLLNGLFFCLCAGANGILTSSNGATWVVRTSINYSGVNNIAYGNGVYVATMYFEYFESSHSVITSTDGITWTQRSVPNVFYPDNDSWPSYTSIIFTAGKFYATNEQGYRISSTNGISWIGDGYVGAPSVNPFPAVPSPPTSGDLRYLNGFYILSSNNGVLYISADGSSWVKVYYPYIIKESENYASVGSNGVYYNLKITYGNGKYVGVNSVPSPYTGFNLITSP